jgi:archaellum component FlaC
MSKKVMRAIQILSGVYTGQGHLWEYLWVSNQMKLAESWGYQSMLAHAWQNMPPPSSATVEVVSGLMREVRGLGVQGVPAEYGGAKFERVVKVLHETGDVAKATALVLAKELVERYIRPMSTQLGSGGSGKGLGKLEDRLRELVGFAAKVLASEFPLPRSAIPEGAMHGEYAVVGDYVIVKDPFNPKVKMDKQVPKEVLDDKDLIEMLITWLDHHGMDVFYRWLVASPGDAVFYKSVSLGLVPGALVLLALYGLGIDPNQLNWEGLINELNRLDEEISRVKAQIKGAKDKNEKAKLKEELERLKSEHEGVLDALITWANAIEALKLVLQKEEWKIVYNSLPKKLRDFIDTAKDPRDSFEEFLKGDVSKIMGVVDKERRRAGKGWVSVDDVGEARERLRRYIPMLDKLIEPIMAKLINEASEGVGAVLNRLGAALDGGLLVGARQSAESTRGMLGQALDRLRSGDLGGAINILRGAIEDLRDVAIKEDGGWVDELVSAVGRLNEVINQLAVLVALNKLVK